jgi:hypothetical protein
MAGLSVARTVADSEVTPHAREDLLRTVRFANEIVETGGQYRLPFRREYRGRSRDNFDLCAALEPANAPGGLHSVQYRKTDIHPDEVWVPRLKYLDRLTAVLRYPDLEAYRLQQPLQQSQFSLWSSTINIR